MTVPLQDMIVTGSGIVIEGLFCPVCDCEIG